MSDFEGYSSDKEECNCLSDVESEIEYFFEPKKSFINKNKTMEDSEEENSENKIKDNNNEELNSDKININSSNEDIQINKKKSKFRLYF